ncbi:MAG: hypothetical protein AB1649_09900 [Chloroflexota bacterium]
MSARRNPIFIGDTIQQQGECKVSGGFVNMLGDSFYKIENYDRMMPFFISIVSSANHWLFISSTGGLTAGRVSAEQSLFPYYTEDKIAENNENTGSKSIFLVTRGQRTSLWEPFSERYRRSYRTQRNLYKNIPGTAILFEEHNFDLGLTFRYAWRTSDVFGFVKSGWLINSGDSTCQVEVLDGMQNILPANITSLSQNTFSPLLDAYKRSELDSKTGLAIFALNSTLTDLAEPSESLLATTAMQLGLDRADYLLSSAQLESFRTGTAITSETEIRGQRCAYFVHASLELPAGAEKAWHLVADVSQDSAAILSLKEKLNGDRSGLVTAIEQDIQLNKSNLEKIVARADGWQVTNDSLCTAHHFANVMFNVMRGGIFSNGYEIQTKDFIDFVKLRNREVLADHAAFFSALPTEMNILDLHTRADASGQADLIRLSYNYLPLTFSRRHGDPSRPWNRFAIDIKKPDGSLKLGYEGNWRDIFQNWEALAYSYPEYVEGMIGTFLNATTVDGYNPYRITRAGIDWEIPESDNPWANIGYWSDHQIIYLQKLMEISAKLHPGKLKALLTQPVFSYANIPYRIRRYADLLANPYNSIEFNWDLEYEIDGRVKEHGTDGRLVYGPDGRILHVNLAEKLLTLLLAKLVNFVPEGGIWMNTQRPEWNDANNALVGRGLSVVTLGYLRRYIAFCQELLGQDTPAEISISIVVAELFKQILAVLKRFESRLSASFDDRQRRQMLEELGQAGSAYRWDFYTRGLGFEKTLLSGIELQTFLDLAMRYMEHSLHANRRSDRLYHSYNILHLDEKQAGISHLYEMLEGQVSILSSGMLSGDESLTLLESLRQSSLYRADQHTYILYPDKTLPGFLQKNSIPSEQVRGLRLPAALAEAGDKSLLIRDMNGVYHFSGQLHNARDVQWALEALGRQPQFAELVAAEDARIAALFEMVFRHNEFTGRSGTFFAYEGLGSIYWHMVSKLLLAVQELALRFQHEPAGSGLAEKYHDIRAGLGIHKHPGVYGAFPTDPYSHTPKGQGARQPGMTGAVKEEILCRQGDVGLCFEDGCLVFNPVLLNPEELLASPATFSYLDVNGKAQSLELDGRSMVITICQVPVILQAADRENITVHLANGNTQVIPGNCLDQTNSQHIFRRDGAVHHLVIQLHRAWPTQKT